VDYLIYVAVVVISIPALIATFYIPVIKHIPFIFVVGILYLAYQLILSRSVEYEYAVTNAYVDIDKIIAKRKRKRLFSADCREFEIVAKVNSQHFNHNIKNIKNKIYAVSDMNSPDVYFFTADTKQGKTVVYFEPDSKILEALKTFIPRKVNV